MGMGFGQRELGHTQPVVIVENFGMLKIILHLRGYTFS